MSDQPKPRKQDAATPTTGENMIWNGDCKVEGCERECVDSSGYCKKHKPTGEWTAEMVLAIFNEHEDFDVKLAHAINAALAAEREKVERMSKAYMVCNQDWQDATTQLASERCCNQTLVDAITEIRDKTTEPWEHRVAWDALAKVKEGK